MQDKCHFYKERLFDYVSDLLTDEERNNLLEHIKLCPSCRGELDKIQEMIGAAAEIPDAEVPESLKMAVSEKLSEIGKGNVIQIKKRRFRRFVSVAMPLAACVALAIGVFSGGVYDKLIGLDDIISSGIEQNSITIETENTDMVEENLPRGDSEIPQGDFTREKKAESQPKAKTEQNKAKGQMQEDKTSSSEAIAEAEQINANNTPAVASINEPQGRMAYNLSAEDIKDEAPAMPSSKASEAETLPSACTVTTDDVLYFVEEYNIENNGGEIYFELSADRWAEFKSFAIGKGAEINATYSDNNNGYISITILER